MTPASGHETQPFGALLAFVLLLGLRVSQVLADAAYDALGVRELILRVLGATPLLALNIRNTPGRSRREKRWRRTKLLRQWHEEHGFLDRFVDPRSVGFKGIFKGRTSVERNHSNGKGNYGLNSLKFRGQEKATIHVALCLSAQLAVALTAHRVGRPDLIRCSTCFTV